MLPQAGRAGVRHLAALARAARPAGGTAESDARIYATEELAAAGFVVHEESFSYSRLPGRYATPVAGALLSLTVTAATGFALGANSAGYSGGVLVTGALTTAIFARRMLRGVTDFPRMRADGINLVASRGSLEPTVWLLAHLDSKSQPVPSLARVSGIVALAFGFMLSCAADLLTLAGHDVRTIWWGALAMALAGAIPVIASTVGCNSDGAVDNASGVAAVLAAAAMLPNGLACGVLLTSAEELGLAGARAFAATHPMPRAALNCDGVDDAGTMTIMFNGRAPDAVVRAVRNASARELRVRRMPLGLLTDSSAMAAAGWPAITVCHGTLSTLRRIHTPNDSLANLRGSAIDDTAAILARAAEVLAS